MDDTIADKWHSDKPLWHSKRGKGVSESSSGMISSDKTLQILERNIPASSRKIG